MLLSENVDNIVRKIIKRKSGIDISDNLLGKILKQEILAWHKQEVNKILDELEKESKTVYYCQGDGAYWDKPNSECAKTCEVVENICNKIFIVIDKQKLSELKK